jgi:hypothetical protein
MYCCKQCKTEYDELMAHDRPDLSSERVPANGKDVRLKAETLDTKTD